MNSEVFDFEINDDEIDQAVITRLIKFSEDEWISYLQKLFYRLNPEPSLRFVSRELVEQLFWIYNTLNETDIKIRMLFTKSVLHILRSIPPQPRENYLIHDLIYFIREVRPIEQRRLLELIIKDESFKDLNYGSDNLHLLLVKAYTYIDDTEKLFLEQYVRNLLKSQEPYSLYIVVYYYSFLGHENKAIDYLFKFFLESKWTENEALCKEIYHSLIDCCKPEYISLFNFLWRFINERITIDKTNIYLTTYIKKFTDYLKTNENNNYLVPLAEAFLNDELDSIRKIEQESSLLDEDVKTMIFEYKAQSLENFVEEKQYEQSIEQQNSFQQKQEQINVSQLAEKTIEDDLFLTATLY